MHSVISVSLRDPLLTRVNEAAREQGITVPALIRKTLEIYFGTEVVFADETPPDTVRAAGKGDQ